MRIQNSKLIIAVLCLLAGVLGCQQPNQSMIVIIEGDGGFPSELVGVWKTQDEKWEIDFLPDGSIREVRISLGGVRLQPGKTLKFDISDWQGKAEYVPGEWKVFYVEEQRELTVYLEIKHLYNDVGNHAIEGNNIDILSGRLSADMREWVADLQTMGKIEALMFEGWTLVERRELHDFDEPEFRGRLVFRQDW